jgi:hypothetical protein
MSFFNQFSFVLISGALLVALGAALWNVPKLPVVLRIGAWLIALSALVGFWLVVRPTDTPNLSTLASAAWRRAAPSARLSKRLASAPLCCA